MEPYLSSLPEPLWLEGFSAHTQALWLWACPTSSLPWGRWGPSWRRPYVSGDSTIRQHLLIGQGREALYEAASAFLSGGGRSNIRIGLAPDLPWVMADGLRMA